MLKISYEKLNKVNSNNSYMEKSSLKQIQKNFCVWNTLIEFPVMYPPMSCRIPYMIWVLIFAWFLSESNGFKNFGYQSTLSRVRNILF